MARLARVVAAGIPHHITQRGNARRFILDCDSDRKVYIDLLKENIERTKVSLLGYCLMSNHVHLVAVPAAVDGLAQALKRTHARYASYWNALHGSSGHAWQGRFYSCPMGETHLWEALRYTELNPVRAGLVADASSWRWSSAGLHCAAVEEDNLVAMATWQDHWSTGGWREFLATVATEQREAEWLDIRRCTYTGRPLGTADFVRALEQRTHRTLAPRKGGRPRKSNLKAEQGKLAMAG
jgi:putative transposase